MLPRDDDDGLFERHWYLAALEKDLTRPFQHLDMASGSNEKPSTPFEWLSGGLFFGKGDKGGIDSIDTCKDVMLLLKGMDQNLQDFLSSDKADDEKEDASKFLAARLSRLRFLLYDERRASSNETFTRKGTPVVAGKTVEGLTGDDLGHLVPFLLTNIIELDFESRKHVAAMYSYLIMCGLDGFDAELYKPVMIQFRQYIEQNYERILTPLVQGHECGASLPDVALHCGTMYRSSLRHLELYQQLVTSTARVQNYAFPFLDKFALFPNFDVASYAMESLKLVLTGSSEHDDDEDPARAELASEFLTRNYQAIFDERFNPKLLSAEESNYMTRRMALQILTTILLTRSNYNVMILYIASSRNLMMIMLLLRDTSPHITLDAFHVFKIFVANPNKPPEIVKILSDNKAKLCKYLETLHKDREASDPQFRDEKSLVISTIEAI